METKRGSWGSVDEYIRAFPEPVQGRLREIRSLVRRIVPEAQENISYRIPTFYLNGNLVHFAAFAKHIGLYPTPSGIERFKDELAGYTTSKGTIQFPHDRPLPLELIERIVRFRVGEANARKRS